MEYYFKKTLHNLTFEDAINKTTEALKEEGFGVLTEIDVKATLKKKLNVDFQNYTILGACNPSFAHKALQAEDKIGILLPCNVIVQQKDGGNIEIAAVDPMASMQAVQNESLTDIAGEVHNKLKKVVDSL
jgi:uncharacterized protein (DUF302 family)